MGQIVHTDGEWVEYGSGLSGFVVKPPGRLALPCLVVTHGNRGCTQFYQELSRKLAKSGYAVICPDLLSLRGGTSAFEDSSAASLALVQQPIPVLLEEVSQAATYMQDQKFTNTEQLGLIGFSWGAGLGWRSIITDSRYVTAVLYCGLPPVRASYEQINASVLGIYADYDERVNATIHTTESTMAELDKTYSKVICLGAQHGFHDDTDPVHYDAGAAEYGWQAASKWLAQHLTTTS